MATIQEQIEAAQKKADDQAKKFADAQKRLRQLKAKKEQVEARKLAQTLTGNRATDTRRKILAGALVLDMMEHDEQTRAKFLDRLDKFLTRSDDRALFSLPEQQGANHETTA